MPFEVPNPVCYIKKRGTKIMVQAVIVDYLRTPFTPAHKGGLVSVRADEAAGQLIRALVKRSGIDPQDVEDVIVGCAFPEAEQGFNIARIIGCLGKLPMSVAATTVNRFCGSSMQALHMAVGAIAMGSGDAFICAGVESMTRVPMGGYNPLPHPSLYASSAIYMGMGETAENLAKQYHITREQQEAFAISSQRCAAAAQDNGHFTAEIAPVERRDGSHVMLDECLRPATDAATLADLKLAFDAAGSVTAGTSSPLTDGAAALLVCSETYAERHHMMPLARVRATAVAGCDPSIMGIGPVAATKKALRRAQLKLSQIDLFELNEAFASQAIACMQELGLATEQVNVDGGAIAIGHPLGATGARISGKAAALLQREKHRYAVATQCIGGGQGIATVLEAL